MQGRVGDGRPLSAARQSDTIQTRKPPSPALSTPLALQSTTACQGQMRRRWTRWS